MVAQGRARGRADACCSVCSTSTPCATSSANLGWGVSVHFRALFCAGLWLCGSVLPAATFIILDFLWYASPAKYELRPQLAVVSDAYLLASSVTALVMMSLACAFAPLSMRARLFLALLSVLVVPLSLFAGLIGSFAVGGLPID